MTDTNQIPGIFRTHFNLLCSESLPWYSSEDIEDPEEMWVHIKAAIVEAVEANTNVFNAYFGKLLPWIEEVTEERFHRKYPRL